MASDRPPDDTYDAVSVHWKPTPPDRWNRSGIRIYWQLSWRKPSGERFLASRRFHPTLDERSILRAWLEAWQGRPFTAEELGAGVWPDDWMGRPCRISVVTGSDGWVTPVEIYAWDERAERRPLTPEGPNFRHWVKKGQTRGTTERAGRESGEASAPTVSFGPAPVATVGGDSLPDVNGDGGNRD